MQRADSDAKNFMVADEFASTVTEFPSNMGISTFIEVSPTIVLLSVLRPSKIPRFEFATILIFHAPSCAVWGTFIFALNSPDSDGARLIKLVI